MAISTNYKIIRQFKNKTAAEIQRETGISKQNLSAWENERSNPGTEFIDQLSEYFGLPRELFYKEGLTLDYLKSHFSSEKHTSVQNRTDNKENMTPRETFYQELIENNQDYSIIPKAILKDYKIVPEHILNMITQSKDDFNKLLEEKHMLIIQGLENKISKLTKENEDLNSRLQRQIPAKNE